MPKAKNKKARAKAFCKGKLYCCECSREVQARLTGGAEVYPHRPDLHNRPFWKCDTCGNFVGCHYKTANRTRPMGCIANKEIKNARMHIHDLIDPIWQSGKISRRVLYARISQAVGWNYHTSSIRTLESAREVYRAAREIARELMGKSQQAEAKND